MAAKGSYVRARVDDGLKRDVETILHTLGLNTTEAIRLFLHQIRIRNGLPFDLLLSEDNCDILLPNSMRQAALNSLYDDPAG
ncbi:MAG: type II toxin-antitoxin system RelB/DinJ family antitoxin [Candidatus Omnitrophica bacterium]|nr:hypothetical protein [bacterium]NUN98463.1 type II toxin-antitoxin system RelB/DinJ family antitoxin [Candidatus Omnitrophota bacterium]